MILSDDYFCNQTANTVGIPSVLAQWALKTAIDNDIVDKLKYFFNYELISVLKEMIIN